MYVPYERAAGGRDASLSKTSRELAPDLGRLIVREDDFARPEPVATQDDIRDRPMENTERQVGAIATVIGGARGGW